MSRKITFIDKINKPGYSALGGEPFIKTIEKMEPILKTIKRMQR